MAQPKIRLKGFTGEWKKTTLGDILTIGNGRDYSQLNSGNIPVYGTGGLMCYVDNYLYDGEVVCIGRKGTIDKPMYFKGKIWTVDTLFYTYGFKDCDAQFIFALFQTINWLNYNEASGVPSLSKKNIEDIEVNIPSLPEQRAIASYFSRLDSLISTTASKVESLKQMKQASLQNMFPQNGEKIPKVRFNGFTGEWKESTLGKVCLINPSSTTLPEYFEYVDLESVVGTELKQHRTENRESAPSRAQRLANKGDIFYQTVRPYQNNNFLFNMDKTNYVFSTGYAQLRTTQHNWFIFNAIQRDSFIKEVLDNCTGTSYPAINPTSLSKISICIPTDVSEQIKIASYFRNLDSQITLQSQRLEKLKQMKAACLDQMFV